ncbi:MAG: hypothetical protein BWY91_01266 [bacterium ADurb.BinA028]|nr:MAG: hypothetical protein BWY91_01266 [bacterium ADurb.BinA028]
MQVRSDVGPLGRPHPLGLLALQPAIEPQRERRRNDDRPREHGGTGERAVDNPTRALPLRDDDDDADHRQRDADDDLHDTDPTSSGPAAATPGGVVQLVPRDERAGRDGQGGDGIPRVGEPRPRITGERDAPGDQDDSAENEPMEDREPRLPPLLDRLGDDRGGSRHGQHRPQHQVDRDAQATTEHREQDGRRADGDGRHTQELTQPRAHAADDRVRAGARQRGASMRRRGSHVPILGHGYAVCSPHRGGFRVLSGSTLMAGRASDQRR